ncbi:HAD domain-containing protein [Deefgea sp. CFH1-16]|uniref:HAD domain-containing protein n=1 Tax=Deefgea sp. CFH1-16 TaxID=2675457 RepID=UPI0015F71601|nr:HAD domain-containing protein [Deefgea sp. CFH1-16]MBM5575322.1 hypothetical protein [Deefgea sp. CFH1-16]
MLIFLDIDGVLHPYSERNNSARQFEQLPRLESVLHDFPEIQVVITSTWRLNSMARILSIFTDDVRPRVLGATPDLSNAVGEGNPRGRRQREAMKFLADRGLLHLSWLAIDDAENWSDEDRLILCDPDIGLNFEVEARLRQFCQI